MQQRRPDEIASVRAGLLPSGKEQALFSKALHGGRRRPGPAEGVEELAYGLLHGLVRIEHYLAGGVIDQANRQGISSSPRLALASWPPMSRAFSTCSSASDIVPFMPKSSRSLKWDGSYRPSSSRISVLASADIFQQPVPVRRAAGQAGDLQAEHHTDLSDADRGNQRWKPARSASAPDWPKSESITTT